MTEINSGRKWMLRALIIFIGILLFTGRFMIVLHRQSSFRGNTKSYELQLEFPTSNVTIDHAVESNLNFKCTFEDRPVCCEVIADEEPIKSSLISHSLSNCHTTKKYIPSAYELKHIQMASVISTNISESQRIENYFDFVYSDMELENANLWLERIRIRSLSDKDIEVSENDIEYLSRFEVTRTCDSSEGSRSHTWLEWIEPLSVHMRHPFSGATCPVTNRAGLNIHDVLTNHSIPFSDLQSTDYILVQSGGPANNANNSSREIVDLTVGNGVRTYLLDVGTAYFDTSLFGLLCMYYKHLVSFTELYGWENTPQDSTTFWNKVPSKYKYKFHFYNIPPMSNTTTTSTGPLHMIHTVTKVNDFVSLKVDVNDLDVEIPLLQQIINDHKLPHLIDELFVNIRFRCEIMMHCGWSDAVPVEKHGVILDRANVLNLFLQIRKLGIRAHIWP